MKWAEDAKLTRYKISSDFSFGFGGRPGAMAKYMLPSIESS